MSTLFQREDWEVIPDCWLLPNWCGQPDQDHLMDHIRSIPKSVWYQPAMPDGTPFSVKVAEGFQANKLKNWGQKR